MPKRQWGVVNPPNDSEFKGNRRSNGFLPLSGARSPVTVSDLSTFKRGAGGSADLARQTSPVIPANAKLADGDPGYTSQPDSAVEPGKGAVPVNPYSALGQGSKRVPLIADDANLRLK